MERSSLSSTLGLLKGKGAHWTTLNPRHLFRAILRESTYLPDSAARHYFRHYIIKRFRKYNPRPPIPAELTERLQQVSVQKELFRKARKYLVFLKRANTGHYPHLKKTLSLTYGLEGRRRRELLQEIIYPAPAVEKVSSPLVSPTHVSEIGPALGKQFIRLAKSQGLDRMMNPYIPSENSWGRPMPIKRVRNLKKKGYANLLSTIVPPLPEQEWERLRDLSLGRIRWEGPVRCRKRAATTAPISIGDRENTGISTSLGLSSTCDNTHNLKPLWRNGVLIKSHRLTPRFMRRMWIDIFSQCTTMKWEAERDNWDIRFMKLPKIHKDMAIPDDSIGSSMFEGVNEEGKIIASKG